MHNRATTAAAVAACVAATAPAGAQTIEKIALEHQGQYQATADLEGASGAGILFRIRKRPDLLTQEWDSILDDRLGEVVQNPIYKERAVEGVNPLYEAGNSPWARPSAPDPLAAADPSLLVQGMSIFAVSNPVATALLPGGDAERTFSANIELYFGDGRVFASSGSGGAIFIGSGPALLDPGASILWSLESDVVLSSGSETVTLHAGSTLTSLVVPAPATAALLALPTAARRRRNKGATR